MRLLLDECVHPLVAGLLTEGGHEVATVSGLGLAGAVDAVVFALARDEHRVIVTLDTDYGELLARTGSKAPSVVLIRRRDHRPESIAAVVQAVVASCEQVLLDGAIAVVGERTVRIRELPLNT